MSTGRAPGKAIVAGEHFVVHGAPALAVPLAGRDVEVRLRRRAGGSWKVPEGTRGHLEGMLVELGEDPEAVGLEVRSRLPVGAGLGGSAALAAALVRALEGPEVSDDHVRERAHRLERHAHGNPSGIDDAVASYGAPVWLQPRGGGADDGSGRESGPVGVEVLHDAPVPPLWVALSAERTATRDAVARVGELARREPERFRRLLGEADALVHAVRGPVERAERRALGEAMDAVQALLAAIEVSTPSLERLIEAARANGAHGAKLTGGGLGGAVIAVAPDDVDLAPALREAGAVEVHAP